MRLPVHGPFLGLRNRHRLRLPIAVVVAALAFPTATMAQSPDRIDLPDGWQPEGVTSQGSSLYVGSLADGAVWKVDAMSGEGEILVPGSAGSVAVGLDVDAGSGRLWLAGGRGGDVRVYDSEDGTLLQTYAFDAGFLNDVAVTPEAAYVTDSFEPQLIVIPIGPDGGLAPSEDGVALPLSGDLEYADGFNLNGVVAADAGLITVHSPTGDLYRVDPDTAATSRIDTGVAELSAGDGLELDGSTLYVVRNQLSRVAVLELDPDLESARLVGELTSDDLDVPATAALVGDSLWAANARFGTPAGPDTEYWLTRLDALAVADD